jgi:FtsH-binding integral membrane protein
VSTFETALPSAAARDQARALFGQTMGLVAVTAGLFALGAYLGRDLSYGWGFVAYIASFALLIAINFAVSRSEQLAVGLLFGFGLLVGVGTAQRLRRTQDIRAAPVLAASIFLDVLNVFLLFLNLFNRDWRRSS